MKARLVDSTARLATWRAAACRVSLFEVPCIVTSPPGGHCDALVNPANEKLEGNAHYTIRVQQIVGTCNDDHIPFAGR